MIGSSLVFAAAHALNPNVTVLGLINLSLFGMFLALYALADQSVWGACAWHALWNWTDASVFGLRDSGGPLHAALLVSVNTRGPDLLTGGAFGPDGGLVETVVLAAGIAIVMVRLQAGPRGPAWSVMLRTSRQPAADTRVASRNASR